MNRSHWTCFSSSADSLGDAPAIPPFPLLDFSDDDGFSDDDDDVL